MANIKSAKKRIVTSEKKNLRNRTVKSEINTGIKKFRAAVSGGEFALAEELLKVVFADLDSAACNDTMHKNKAARNKAKLSMLLHDAKSKVK